MQAKNRSTITLSVIRLLVLLAFAIQNLVAPVYALASIAPPPSTSLVRGRDEQLDAYLQRVANLRPDVFQQAAIASVQDAFNGRVPETAGEKAMEEQIAFYLDKAARNPGVPMSMLATAPASATTFNTDGAYRWNDSTNSPNGLATSDWQMLARPGVDQSEFAKHFEAMMAQEKAAASAAPAAPSAATAPEGLATAPAADPLFDAAASEANRIAAAALPQSVSIAAPAAAAEATSANTPAAADAVNAPADTSIEAVVVERPLERAAAQAAEPASADLTLTMTAPSTANFGDVISYTLVVTNAGPAAATAVQVTQTLPANGTYTETIESCVAATGVPDTLVCSFGALAVNESKTLNVAVHMRGNDVLTSTAVIADNGGSIDPAADNNSAEAAVTVSSTTRETREVGKVVIAANQIVTNSGKVEATGSIWIGHKKADDSIVYHLALAGAEDTISWPESGGESIEGNGKLVMRLNTTRLFSGAFTIDGASDNPLVVPNAVSVSEVNSISDFALTGAAGLSEITVISGTASITAAVKLGGSGAVSDTGQTLTGTMFPDGSVSGEIDQFATTVAGIKFTVNKATLSQKAFSIQQAQLTMPEKLGKLTGTVKDLRITAKSIDFGSAGVKIPLPDILPGKKVTDTAGVTTTGSTSSTVTPKLSIVKNTATVSVAKGKYVAAVEGTLQLRLPSNKRDIPIEIKIDSNGDLEGTVKEIKLNIAGQELSMKNVVVGSDGLKVKEATLTFQGAPAKNKKAEAERGRNGALAAPATGGKDKAPDKKLSVIIKNVSIDGDGVKLGGIGITNYLPDVKIGSHATFSKMEFTVVVNDPTSEEASFELAIKGTLKIHIKGNQQDIKFDAKRDKDGNFSGTLSQMSLTIAGAKLQLKTVKFDDSGMSASDVSLTLPPKLNGATATMSQFKIDENGISFGDASVKVPIEFTIGSKEGSGNKIAVKGNLTVKIGKDRDYSFEIEGKVTVNVAKQTAEAEGKIGIDGEGKISGSLESFKLVVAGMELAIKEAKIEEGVFEAAEATLSVPKAWGGLTATVYKLRVGRDEFSIGGGEFQLPEIKIGDMKLALKAKLKKEGDGYIIAAGGTLAMPNLGGNGCSGMGISAEIATGSAANNVIMRVKPLSAADYQAFRLREAKVSLECTIALGASGFDLTKIEGTLALADNTTKISIKATMEHKARVKSFSVLTSEAEMTIERVKNPPKFEIGIAGSMKIFSMFEAARAKASMRFTDGDVPFLFKAEMNIDAEIAKGEVKLNAWTKNGEFFLTGRIWGKVGVKRGAISDSCWSFRVPDGIAWWGRISWREVRTCLAIPPSDWYVDATMEFGKFQKNDGNEWGFKAGVNILGKNYGVFVDGERKFSVGNVDQYRLVDAPTLQRAQRLHQVLASGERIRSALGAEEAELVRVYTFNGVEVDVKAVTLTQPGDLGVSVLLADIDADVQVSLRRPDGLLFNGTNAPANVTFKQQQVAAGQITDPVTGQPAQTLPMMQRFLNVTNADLGEWTVVLSRQPTAGFIVNVDGTKYGPPVANMALTNLNHALNTVDLTWSQSAVSNTVVTVYASQGAITTTASYTEAVQTVNDGIASTHEVINDLGVVTQFGGAPIKTFAYASGAVTPTESLDLSSLKSGVYNLWLEVDDGRNTPSRKYFPGEVAVEHPWAETWQGNTAVTPTLGGLIVSWAPNANTDVDGYELRVVEQTADPYNDDVYVVDVGDGLSQTVSGLSAKSAYSVTVVAYDTGTGSESTGGTAAGTPLRAPFNAVAQPAAVNAIGGNPVNAGVRVASSIAPYPGQVFLTVEDVSDGLEAEFVSEQITPTVAGVLAGLVVTPDASLPSGLYTVTVSAASSGDVTRIEIPVTVSARDFSLQADAAVAINTGGTASVAVGTSAINGESNEVSYDVEDMPDGIDWAFAQSDVAAGLGTQLHLTATEYALPGTYTVTVVATDRDHTHIKTLALSVNGFGLATDWDSYATATGVSVTFGARLEGAGWTAPAALSIDPTSAGGHFSINVPGTANVPAAVDIAVMPRKGTPPGVYELILRADSTGVRKTLPLFVTVPENAAAPDLQALYAPQGEARSVIAGESYSYTVKARNISANDAANVTITDTTEITTHLTLLSNGGCTADQTDLVCAQGTVTTHLESASGVIAWQVAADAPDGFSIVHAAEAVTSGSAVTESATHDNTTDYEVIVNRLSDISVLADASTAVAGQTFTLSATVRNDGPSNADNVETEIYLPENVNLESASAGCVQDAEFVKCELGTLAPSAQRQLTATLRVEGDAREALETLISATSDSDDPDLDNNVATADTTVSAEAQLRVSVTSDAAATVNEGQERAFTIVLTNDGPSQATGASIALALPQHADLTHITRADAGDADTTGDAGGSTDEETGTLDGYTLDASEAVTLTVTLRFPEDSRNQPVTLGVTASAVEAPNAQASSAPLRVLNLAPTAVFSATLTAVEGEWGVLNVYMTDAGAGFDPLTAQWDMNNDGVFNDGEGGLALFDARNIDGPAERLISVRVRDDEGGEVILSGVVKILNAAPVVDAGPDQLKPHDQTFTLNVNSTDRYLPDGTSRVTVNWGDGNIETSAATSAQAYSRIVSSAQLSAFAAPQLRHTFNRIGKFNAEVCVTDDDSGQRCDQVVLQAACIDHGVKARIVPAVTVATLVLDNSGSVTLPAGFAVTLYAGQKALATYTLARSLKPGETVSFEYRHSSTLDAVTLHAVLDDNGSGAKLTTFCSGSVSQSVSTPKIFLPLTMSR